MSMFRKLSHAIWHCQYHLIWVPKYRYGVLVGTIGSEVADCVRLYCAQLESEVIELNVQSDHVHLIVMVPPKVSISNLIGRVKGRTAIRVFHKYPDIRQKKYWVNHFWAEGYCVDTIGLDAEMVRKYVKYQEKRERKNEQLQLKFNK